MMWSPTVAAGKPGDTFKTTGYEADFTAEEETALIKDFTDLESVDDELKSDAELLIQLGILQGRDNKHMAPGAIMSRGEAAALIVRLLNAVQ